MSETKVWLSDEVVASAKNTTIQNRLNIGPKSMQVIPVSDTNNDGQNFKFSPTVNTNLIYDKGIIMSAKPKIIITGITVPDSRGVMVGGTAQYNGAVAAAGDTQGSNAFRWTGEGCGVNRFFTPKTACLSALPLNNIIGSRTVTLNDAQETFLPEPELIDAYAHFASERQKAGYGIGDFTVDKYDDYNYYASPFPQFEQLVGKPTASNASSKVIYPYGYSIDEEIEGDNVIEQRHYKLPKYKSEFKKNDSSQTALAIRTVNGIDLPYDTTTNEFYYGPLVEIITFEDPIEEPLIHPLLKFRDDSTKLFLENLTTFEISASLSTTASRAVRFSYGNKTTDFSNAAKMYSLLPTGTAPAFANPWAVADLTKFQVSDGISTIQSVSVEMKNSDFKIYMNQFSVSPLIERKMTSKYPYHKNLTRSVIHQNTTAGKFRIDFDTHNLGSIPYYMMIYGIYNSDRSSNFKPNRRVKINGVQVGLGTDDAIFSDKINRERLVELTDANGLSYNSRTKRNAKTVRDWGSYFVQQNGCMVPITISGATVGYTVQQADNNFQQQYQAPHFRDVRPAGDFVLLNFVNDICAMSQSLASGTMCNLQFNLSVDVETTEAGPITLYCLLVEKYEMTLDRTNATALIKKELFTATQVLDGVKTVNGNRITVVDDLLIGGNLFSSVKNNFQRWLPKIRSLIDTGKQMYGTFQDAKATYNEHMKPHVDQAKKHLETSNNESLRNVATRLNNIGL